MLSDVRIFLFLRLYSMNSRQFQQQILCYADQVYRMALSILKDESRAQDLYQDLMMRLWEKRDQLGMIQNRRAFLLASMRNMCIDIYRKEPLTGEIPEGAEDELPNPYQRIEQSDTLHYIHRLINELPETQRITLRMKDVEELEIEEISEILSMTENAVTVNLSRARKKMREMIIATELKEKKHYERY